jgi:two-component system, OmpR family, sensor histidine kinase KdpD
MTDGVETTKQRLLVAVGPSPSNANVIKATKHMADGLKAHWYAVYVEDPEMLRLPEAERNRAVYNLRLAEQLGAETITLRGRDIAAELVNFARQRMITKIIAGKPTRSRWRDFLRRAPVDGLLRQSGNIDVYVIAGEPGEPQELPVVLQPKIIRRPGYEMALFYLVLATGLCFLMYPFFDLPNLIMVYLLGVLVTAVQCGRGPAILNSFLSVLAFNFCFIPPRWTFRVEEAKYVVTFVVMFLVAAVISHLASLIQRQAEAARLQERQTASLFALSHQLAGTRGLENILQVAIEWFSEIFQCQTVALLPDEKGKLHVAAGEISSVLRQDIIKELGVAQEAFQTGRMAGWSTQTRPDSPVLYVPLIGTNVTLGILALRPRDLEAEQWLLPEQLRLHYLESLAKQIALALEVEQRLQDRGSVSGSGVRG